MAESIDVVPGVRVPGSAIEVRAVRASGPGGQNVNKVSSRVELLIDLSGIEGLPEGALARLRALPARRFDAGGRLRLTAQESRDRARNLESAREKARELIEGSLKEPAQRRPTRPGKGAREGRLREKKLVGRAKLVRRAPRHGEED
jgi:ribosome-associated protein